MLAHLTLTDLELAALEVATSWILHDLERGKAQAPEQLTHELKKLQARLQEKQQLSELAATEPAN